MLFFVMCGCGVGLWLGKGLRLDDDCLMMLLFDVMEMLLLG